MTVFPDEVFFLNVLLDFLLLGTASLLSDCPKKRYRMLLAALLGGLYAAFASVFVWLTAFPMKLLFAVLICLLAYGTGKKALRQTMLFGLVCCGFGGMVLLASLLLKSRVQLLYGVPYFTLSKRLLILLAGLLYTGVWLTMRRLCRHFGELVSVRFSLQGRCAEVTALCDTGNTLKDPLSAEPVIIADLKTAQTLFPQIGISEKDLRQPASLLQTLLVLCPASKPRLLPFRTVGGSGLLLAVKCESIEVNGKGTGHHILAFSATAFSETETYQALTGGIYESKKNTSSAAGISAQGVRSLHWRKRHSSAAACACGGATAAAKNDCGG